VPRKAKQYLSLIRHPTCYSYGKDLLDTNIRGRRLRGTWIYNYLCNQCLSPLMVWVRISIKARCTTLCDKVCQWRDRYVVFSGSSDFLQQYNWPLRYDWNVVEI